MVFCVHVDIWLEVVTLLVAAVVVVQQQPGLLRRGQDDVIDGRGLPLAGREMEWETMVRGRRRTLIKACGKKDKMRTLRKRRLLVNVVENGIGEWHTKCCPVG